VTSSLWREGISDEIKARMLEAADRRFKALHDYLVGVEQDLRRHKAVIHKHKAKSLEVILRDVADRFPSLETNEYGYHSVSGTPAEFALAYLIYVLSDIALDKSIVSRDAELGKPIEFVKLAD
jgi:hypothetical protein